MQRIRLQERVVPRLKREGMPKEARVVIEARRRHNEIRA
jgi:hypothetical protein